MELGKMTDAEIAHELVAQAEGEPLNGISGFEPKVNVWEMKDGSFIVHHLAGDGTTQSRERYDNEVTAKVEADEIAREEGMGGIRKRVTA